MNLSNKISIFRIILIPFFILSAAAYTPQNPGLKFIALGIFLLAVISDATDGYIARIRKQKTVLGTFLDPLADKLILTSAFVCLLIFKNITPVYKLPFWFLLLIISRDVIIVLGSLLIHMIRGNLKISPRLLGKITTFFQMLSVIMFMLQVPAVTPWVMYITAILTVASGIDYIRIGSRYFNEA
jgi:CDP-diacylglycerol--glycerol-3-phosphate 3-phosphatidyltransferase